MVCLTDRVCGACRKKKPMTQFSTMCYDCKAAEGLKQKKEYTDRLEAMTIEERLKNIEEFMYYHTQNHPR